MKANKPLKEAIFRAPETTDENKQPQQEQLYHMGSVPAKDQQTTAADEPQDLVNESHINRMANFQQLREMEYDVEKKIGKKKK